MIRTYQQILAVFFCVIVYATPIYSFNHHFLSDEFIQQIYNKHGDYPARRFKAWRKVIESSKSLNEMNKIAKVNDFFNQLRYMSDISYKGEPDYWMTPVEFLIAGGGDCEDFSIAKYFTLLALGIPAEKLRITYVKALNLNQAHMVLAYYPKPHAEPFVLDNLTANVLRASKRKDLKPVYSFNGNGLWLAKQRGEVQRVGSSKNLSKWQKVIKRMRKEGEKQ